GPDDRLVAGGAYLFTPAEFARVYGLGSATGALVDGTGQTIGIVGVSAIDPSDVTLFRSSFGVPPMVFEQTSSRRTVGSRGELEAILDVTWSGAVAPGAPLVLAVGRAVVDSLAVLVNREDVSVITLSVALCRTKGSGALIRTGLRLFRQAAAQGQS